MKIVGPFYDILSDGPYFRKARWPPCFYVTVAKMNVADHCMPIFSSHWNISAQSYGPSKDGSSQGGFHFQHLKEYNFLGFCFDY